MSEKEKKKKHAEPDAELTDEDLDKVAGGGNTPPGVGLPGSGVQGTTGQGGSQTNPLGSFPPTGRTGSGGG